MCGSQKWSRGSYSLDAQDILVGTDAVLLIDASNAFNSLNRAAALHNTRVLCPSLATYVINSYREPARLVVTGGKEIKSAKGTTQGDPVAMSLYAIRLQLLISRLSIFSQAKQCWYADDATSAGSLEELRKWWKELNNMGPSLVPTPTLVNVKTGKGRGCKECIRWNCNQHIQPRSKTFGRCARL